MNNFVSGAQQQQFPFRSDHSHSSTSTSPNNNGNTFPAILPNQSSATHPSEDALSPSDSDDLDHHPAFLPTGTGPGAHAIIGQGLVANSTDPDAVVDEDGNTPLTSQTLNTDGTPKRPMNAFMIFARRRRPQVSAENQQMRTGEISKILSREWNTMPGSEKQFYLDQAKLLKDNFNNRYPDYVYRRRPNHSRRKRKDGGVSDRSSDWHGGGGPQDDSSLEDPRDVSPHDLSGVYSSHSSHSPSSLSDPTTSSSTTAAAAAAYSYPPTPISATHLHPLDKRALYGGFAGSDPTTSHHHHPHKLGADDVHNMLGGHSSSSRGTRQHQQPHALYDYPNDHGFHPSLHSSGGGGGGGGGYADSNPTGESTWSGGGGGGDNASADHGRTASSWYESSTTRQRVHPSSSSSSSSHHHQQQQQQQQAHAAKSPHLHFTTGAGSGIPMLPSLPPLSTSPPGSSGNGGGGPGYSFPTLNSPFYPSGGGGGDGGGIPAQDHYGLPPPTTTKRAGNEFHYSYQQQQQLSHHHPHHHAQLHHRQSQGTLPSISDMSLTASGPGANASSSSPSPSSLDHVHHHQQQQQQRHTQLPHIQHDGHLGDTAGPGFQVTASEMGFWGRGT